MEYHTDIILNNQHNTRSEADKLLSFTNELEQQKVLDTLDANFALSY